MGKLRTAAQKAQTVAAQAKAALSARVKAVAENTIPLSASNPAITGALDTRRKTTTKSTISRLNKTIDTLNLTITALRSENEELRRTIADQAESLEEEQSLTNRITKSKNLLSKQLSSARKAIRLTQSVLRKAQKRTRRLEKDKLIIQAKEKELLLPMADLDHSLSLKAAELEESVTAHAFTQSKLDDTERKLTIIMETVHTLRKERKALNMRVNRAKSSLADVRSSYQKMLHFHAKDGTMYSAETRATIREACDCGCAEDKVARLFHAFAHLFGIDIGDFDVSARTVGRIKQEGGFFGMMQLGREITNAEGILCHYYHTKLQASSPSPNAMIGFVESCDGTTHRKINMESLHSTLFCPTYDEGVDDSDRSTWKPQTRFMAVAPTLAHTAVAQVDHSRSFGNRIAGAYSESPLAKRDGNHMDIDDYLRKQIGQVSDHASDQKKKFALTQDIKKELLLRDLGEEHMDALTTTELLHAILAVSNEEITDSSGRDIDSLWVVFFYGVY